MSSSQLTFIFFRGVGRKTTNQQCAPHVMSHIFGWPPWLLVNFCSSKRGFSNLAITSIASPVKSDQIRIIFDFHHFENRKYISISLFYHVQYLFLSHRCIRGIVQIYEHHEKPENIGKNPNRGFLISSLTGWWRTTHEIRKWVKKTQWFTWDKERVNPLNPLITGVN